MLAALGPPGPQYTKQPHRRPSARALLSSRSQIDYLDAGLHSVQGALEIISTITSRPTVTKLILSHNALQDDGCIVLFKFLCSDVGRTKRISEIKLAKNGIGDRGLLAISEYLKGNQTLKELYLPVNAFQSTPSIVSTFTSALNTSHLEKLDLSSNSQLSDAFAATLFPRLNSLHLRDICLSTVGLTPLSVPDIISYISSPRCRLHNLSLNGNTLGLRGVTDIIRTVEKNNFGLAKMELYANQPGGFWHEDTEAAKENKQVLKRALIRNQYLKRQTEKEALSLLMSARASLLRPNRQQEVPAPPYSPQPTLPTELLLHILSFLAPTLSSAQHIQIYTYASTFSTLPDLLPRLPSNGSRGGVACLSDPMRLIGVGNFTKIGYLDGCIKGVVCQREEQRERWLKVVGCDSYELRW